MAEIVKKTRKPESENDVLHSLMENVYKSSEYFVVKEEIDPETEKVVYRKVEAQNLPFPELFLSDFSTSNLDEFELEIVRAAMQLSSTHQFLALQKGLDLQPSVRFFIELAQTYAITSKSKKGFLALLTRSMYQHTSSKQDQVTTLFEGQKKNKGFFG